MALLDDMRERVRVTATATDSEIDDLIFAAIYDMRRCGVKAALLEAEHPSPLVKQAVSMYVRAYYGMDNHVERPQFVEAYNRAVIDLLNSKANEYLFPDASVSDQSGSEGGGTAGGEG